MTDRYQQVESFIEKLNEFERETGLHFDFREGRVRDAETWDDVARLGYDGEQFTVHRADDE